MSEINKRAAQAIREYAERTHEKHDIRFGCPRCDLTAALRVVANELEYS